jgi:hypothetical protein
MWDHVRTVRTSHHPLRLFVAKVHFVEFQWCFALWHHAIGCEISQLWSIMETIGNRLLCVHSLATDEDTSAPVFGFSFILFYSILCCVSPCFPCRHIYRTAWSWSEWEENHHIGKPEASHEEPNQSSLLHDVMYCYLLQTTCKYL